MSSSSPEGPRAEHSLSTSAVLRSFSQCAETTTSPRGLSALISLPVLTHWRYAALWESNSVGGPPKRAPRLVRMSPPRQYARHTPRAADDEIQEK